MDETDRMEVRGKRRCEARKAPSGFGDFLRQATFEVKV